MLVIGTGGTFDKDYAIQDGSLTFTQSHIPSLLADARITCNHRFISLFQKDSLDINIEDRMSILETCRSVTESDIVIVHGTDTITETAVFLHNAQLDKTIVLTGAMRPVAFGHSDAAFNLGYAIALSQSLPNGVYIAIQGELFPAGHVIKDKQKALFVRQV